MKRSFKLKIIAILLIFSSIMISGCSLGNSLLDRDKNEDFEFLGNGSIVTIVIQSARDKGFRFLVTDEDTINELYFSLSRAQKAEEKPVLDPDYIFEFHDDEGDIKYYYYIAGVSKLDRGNFYNDEAYYKVTDRIDNHLISNLYSLRKPKYFEDAYYESIIELAYKVRDENKDKSIGVKIEDDLEVLKYQTSREIADFKDVLKEKDIILLESNDPADIILEIKTVGYTTIVYKAVVDAKGLDKQYYIYSKYKNDINKWDKIISEDKPENF